MKVREPIVVVLIVTAIASSGCSSLHPILTPAVVDRSAPSLQKFAAGKVDTPAIVDCQTRADTASRAAKWMEGVGISVGILGLIGTATFTAELAHGTWSDQGYAAWGLSLGASATALGVAAYLLSGASYNRQGFALLDGALVQMKTVDPFFPLGEQDKPLQTGVSNEKVMATQYQTCAKAVTAWAASAGNADTAAANIFSTGAGK